MKGDIAVWLLSFMLGVIFGMSLLVWSPPDENGHAWKRMLRAQEIRRFVHDLDAKQP